MKKTAIISLIAATFFLFSGCEALNKDDGHISGTQSPFGEVGASVTADPSISGIETIEGTVTENIKGVSTLKLTGTVTNPLIKTIVSTVDGFSISDNTVTAPTLRIKATDQGFESIEGFEPGIIVNYNSKVGDTYTTTYGTKRKVTKKSTTDDYEYGFYNIKVMKIEEPKKHELVDKIVYYANHRFGIVGISFILKDQTEIKFAVYLSAPQK